ncbi:hypothetical protein E8E15_010902 [Penicillium rubens]|uniref:uncharacterized protein n=1 Tax=Penicillium rubens TaxID=1108849 RepID=UPI001DAA033B|nr:uncharacterized protein N7525_010624 [Penicillium rubens]KAF3028690.1 hypothetical protein E8E15_010902 [Penicillium rubens]KAJ5036304.1 hypothetical protein NUH16_004177 [Penicillium rubens]KAJ5821340.1 hypothetical protein N7525_010624 [Penicillium rubens]
MPVRLLLPRKSPWGSLQLSKQCSPEPPSNIKAATTAGEACFSANHDIMKDAEESTSEKLENQAIALRPHITHLQELCSAIAAPINEGRPKKRRRQTRQPRPNRTF